MAVFKSSLAGMIFSTLQVLRELFGEALSPRLAISPEGLVL
jgi:hypothetical protein